MLMVSASTSINTSYKKSKTGCRHYFPYPTKFWATSYPIYV